MNYSLKVFFLLLLLPSYILGDCFSELSAPITSACDQPITIPINTLTNYITGTKRARLVVRYEILDTCGITLGSSSKMSMMRFLNPTTDVLSDQVVSATYTMMGSYNSDGTTFDDFISMNALDISPGGYNQATVTIDFAQPTGSQISGSMMSSKSETNFQYTKSEAVPTSYTWDDITLHLCCNFGRNRCFSCKIHELTLVYIGSTTGAGVYAQHGYYFGLKPKLLGEYKFLEAPTSYSLTDSKGLIGTAYLGTSTSTSNDTTNSPTWGAQRAALSFTATKFVTIPLFPIVSSGVGNQYSLSLSFWIYWTGNSAGYIWRRSSSDLSTDRFGLKVTSAGVLTGIMGAQSTDTTTQPLVSNTWTQILVHYRMSTFIAPNAGRSNKIFFLKNLNTPMTALPPDMTTTGTVTLDANDVVHLGGPDGFTGQIADLKIFSPGSIAVLNPGFCSPSASCKSHLGVTEPPVCLSATCHASCATNSCFDEGETSCMACSAAKYFYERKCQACPGSMQDSGGYCTGCLTDCSTCSATYQCQACSGGKFLYDSICSASCPGNTLTYQQQCVTSCPVTTFESSGTCANCPSDCDTCSSTSTCQTCSSGKYNNQDQCVASCPGNTVTYQQQCVPSCPVTTFESSGTCANCPSDCDTCSSTSTCQTCSSGKYNNQGQCVASCPGNTITYQQQCVTSCPVTTFESSGTCANCPSDCDTCSSTSTCQTCSSGKYNNQGQCVASCPGNTITYQQQCVTSCPGNTLTYQQQCVTSCPVTTFESSGTCANCPSDCDTCSSTTACQVCSSGKHLHQNQCVASCPAGYNPVDSTCVVSTIEASSSGSGSGISEGAIAGIVCGSVAAVIVIGVGITYFHRKRKRSAMTSQTKAKQTDTPLPTNPGNNLLTA